MAPLATEKTLDRGLGGRCQEKTNTGPAAPNSSVVSPYVAPNSTRHAACAERKWGRTGQGRDTRSPSLNVTKLTEREGEAHPGWPGAQPGKCGQPSRKPSCLKKKKRAGRRKIYIHACQNRQRTAETILKCTKILKHYVCTSNYQHWRSNTLGEQTHRKRDEICGYQAQSGGGAGGRWSKVQTCSCKVSTTDVMYTMTNVINMLHVTYELRVNPKGFHHKENNFFVLFCIYETMDIH